MKEIMKTTLLANDLAFWPSFALVLFSLVMLGVILWIHRPGSKEYYQSITSSIIDGDETHE